MGIYPKQYTLFFIQKKKLNEISKYPYDVITDYLKLKEEISKYIS